MTAFAELGLSEAALAAVERMGYDSPTPVQEQSIPYILEGRDVIAAASTGTGKTAAFLLPTLSTLERMKGRGRAPRVCVVSPTRELAQQISRTCMQISRKTGHFVTTVYGGTPYGPQIRELRGGTDVLIATPGRLNDLMDRGVVDLSETKVLVLDEADRMLDMGFLPDVTKIVEHTPAERQTLLFSATIDSSIQKNLGNLLKDPAIIEIARNGETAATVAQYIMPIANRKKQELLEAVLNDKGHERVIVFARTKNRTEECAEALEAAGFHAESIHSDKTQGRRRRALENFRRGKTDILVATDVLARGIDVPEVNYVINFDLPDMAEDYVHRIGRTGRAGEEGFAISFVTRETMKTLKEIEKLIGKDIPFTTIEGYETDPSVLEKPKRGERKGGTRRGGNKPAGARRTGEKHAERAEREGRRPNAGEGRRRREDDTLVTRGERGGRGGKQHVLKTLYYADGQMTQRVLLEKTKTTSASLSEVVGKLESAGLVERERSEADRRQLVVRLTDEGRARAEAVIADKERFEHDAFSCLGPGELDELLGLLDRLHDHWERLKRNEDERGDTVWLKN